MTPKTVTALHVNEVLARGGPGKIIHCNNAICEQSFNSFTAKRKQASPSNFHHSFELSGEFKRGIDPDASLTFWLGLFNGFHRVIAKVFDN